MVKFNYSNKSSSELSNTEIDSAVVSEYEQTSMEFQNLEITELEAENDGN